MSFIESLTSFFTPPTKEAVPTLSIKGERLQPAKQIELGGCTRLEQLRVFLVAYRQPGDHRDLQVVEAQEQIKAFNAIDYKMTPLQSACIAVKDQYAKVAYAKSGAKSEGYSEQSMANFAAELRGLRESKDRLDVLTTEVVNMVNIEVNGIRHPVWGVPAQYISESLATLDVRTLLHSAENLSVDAGEALVRYNS